MYLQEIAEALELAPSTISHHIQILLNTMLVSVTVDAMNSRKIFYETNKDKVKELGESIKTLFQIIDIRSDYYGKKPQCYLW